MPDDDTPCVTVDEVVEDYNSNLRQTRRKKNCCNTHRKRRAVVVFCFLAATACFTTAACLKNSDAVTLLEFNSSQDKAVVGLLLAGSVFFVFFVFCIQLFYCHYTAYNQIGVEPEEATELELVLPPHEQHQRFDDV